MESPRICFQRLLIGIVHRHQFATFTRYDKQFQTIISRMCVAASESKI